MNRRVLLQLTAAAAFTGCQLRPSPRKLRVVVAGAGIIGASIALHLTRRGVAVTVIDQAGPATQSTRGTFAWINASWAKQPRHYHALSQRGVSDWHTLQQQLRLPIRWGGSVEWFATEARQERLKNQIAEQRAWGEPARMLDPNELARFEPQLRIGDTQHVAFSPNDGAIDPVAATHKLLAVAQRLGASVEFPCALEGVVHRGGRLTTVRTSTGDIPADRLVLATGAAPDVPLRFAGLDIPQRTTPGVIVITKPQPRSIQRIIAAPGVHMHQRDDGRIVLGEQAGAPQTEAHENRLRDRPITFPTQELALLHATRILNTAARYVPEVASATVEEVHIGWRPLPIDGHPVLGESPVQRDVYLAIMHSGVSLAPVVGQLVATELVDERLVAQLTSYRPSRAFVNTRRY